MASTNPTGTLPRDERRKRVRQLAADKLSNREIARQLGIGKDTVARDLRATEAPQAPTPAPHTAPPAMTSGAPFKTRLIRDLDPELIKDLNVLTDRRTGRLPAPLARIIRAAADQRRAAWLSTVQRRDETAP
jgi:hypothetical protein